MLRRWTLQLWVRKRKFYHPQIHLKSVCSTSAVQQRARKWRAGWRKTFRRCADYGETWGSHSKTLTRSFKEAAGNLKQCGNAKIHWISLLLFSLTKTSPLFYLKTVSRPSQCGLNTSKWSTKIHRRMNPCRSTRITISLMWVQDWRISWQTARSIC